MMVSVGIIVPSLARRRPTVVDPSSAGHVSTAAADGHVHHVVTLKHLESVSHVSQQVSS